MFYYAKNCVLSAIMKLTADFGTLADLFTPIDTKEETAFVFRKDRCSLYTG
jgi:hypothetical protein